MSVILYYNVEQLAEKLNLNAETVRRKLRKGEIIGTKYGKSWRITEEDLKNTLKLWTSHINQIDFKIEGLEGKSPRVLRKIKGQKQKLFNRLEVNSEIKV